MMAVSKKVIRTESRFFFDRAGHGVNGYEITVRFAEWGEDHSFLVASLDPAVVTPVIDEFVRQRTALGNLG